MLKNNDSLPQNRLFALFLFIVQLCFKHGSLWYVSLTFIVFLFLVFIFKSELNYYSSPPLYSLFMSVNHFLHKSVLLDIYYFIYQSLLDGDFL